ncbi:fluoride efflux transporter FluC [Naumannella cuiyingiana]|uniref:Fluoride-specific ion channel n=1 Tax=Naumannella cuiyingiana TaxID=1347891 RepID=A0A7Z0ILD8_9ACTN|nr:CrcB family protein [Naumannella cuiyingiana]NYI71422.1 CrcB protein [Naumannella cuiyingiana]
MDGSGSAGSGDRPGLPVRTLALVGIGGAAGVVARQALSTLGDPTLVVAAINVVGAFGLGLLVGALRDHRAAAWALPLAGTGFLGAFTTLSGMTGLFAARPDPWLLLLIIGQVVLGVIAAWGGLEAGLRLRGRGR